MSLINDALKKAQKQRAADASGGAGQAAPPTVTQSAAGKHPAATKRVLILVGVGAVLLVAMSVGTTLIFLRNQATTVDPRNAPPPHSALPVAGSIKPAAAIELPIIPIPSPQAAATSAVSHSPPPANPDHPVAAITSTTLPVSASGPADAGPPPSPAPKEIAAAVAPHAEVQTAGREGEINLIKSRPVNNAKKNLRIQILIDKLRIAGMRMSGEDSKVILNDRLFRLHEMIEPSLGLRLEVIDSHTLTFSDSAGNLYVKRF